MTASARIDWWKRLLLVLAMVALALLVGEVLLRVRTHVHNRHMFARALSKPLQPMKGGDATLGEIIRLSPDDRIIYELKPGLVDVRYEGQLVSTNSLGIRSPEPSPKHSTLDTRPVVTVVGLGDGGMFGQGVADGQTYLDGLRQRLAMHTPGVRWDVWNTAVPGYNTAMEVATYETKGLALQPDLVVLGMHSDDYDPPEFVHDGDDALDPERSFVFELFRSLPPRKDLDTPGLVRRSTWARENVSARGSASSAPRRYHHAYGPAALRGALERLHGLTVRDGVRCIALAMLDDHEVPAMMDTARAVGLETLHAQPHIEQHVAKQFGRPFSWMDYGTSALVVHPAGEHPSVAQHALVAKLLFEHLRDTGWIEESARKARVR